VLLVVAVVALVVAAATYLTWIAGRLDRLMVRVESLWATLDGQLTARAFAAHELAHLLDDPDLHAAARGAGTAKATDRETAENRLSRALHAALPDGLGEAAERVPAVVVAAAGVPGAAPSGQIPAPRLPARSTSDPALGGLPINAREAAADVEAILVKVALARHFYNDAVRDYLALRSRRVPRLLHLYGRATAPTYFEFDSSMPERVSDPLS
jgi:hypothetical protein